MSSTGPNSPGTMADDPAIGTKIWGLPDLAKTSDNFYASCIFSTSGQTHYLKATNFGFAIDAGAAIDGIVVEIEKSYVSGSTIVDTVVRLVIGGVVSGNNATPVVWPISDSYSTYGGAADKWGLAPTVSQINGADFGVVLSATGTRSGKQAPNALVDHIRITVYYTEASPEPPAPPVPDKVFCSPTRLVRIVTGCRNNMPVRIVTSGGDPVRIVASGGDPVRVVTHGGDPVRIVEGEI